MSETILVIGEAPGRASTLGPLEGVIGARLADYAGLTWTEYLELTERHNLLSQPADRWPATTARNAAQTVWPSLVGRRTILLGRNVARAFGFLEGYLTWRVIDDDRGTEVAIVPHPSERNPWWNDSANRSHARRFLRLAFGSDVS